MFHAEQRAKNVGVKGGRVGFGGLFGHRTGNAFGTGVIDGHIQATKTRDGLVNQSSYFGFVTHVRAYKFGLSADFAEFSDELRAFLVASARDNEMRALLCEGQCGGTPDAGERASDQNDGGSHEGSPRKMDILLTGTRETSRRTSGCRSWIAL